MINENYEAHKDEVELLKNILFEQLTILNEEPNFVLEIEITPDVVENPILKFRLKFSLDREYPNVGPNLEIQDESNYLASYKIKALIDQIKEFEIENLGMPMLFQIYEMVKDFSNEQEDIMHKEKLDKLSIEDEKKKKYEEKQRAIEKELIETRTFTPVTKENYEAWFKKFYAEHMKGKQKKVEQDLKMSGREYFMNAKNLKIEEGVVNANEEEPELREGDNKEINQEETLVEFDSRAFEENIDDIDFDQDYDDDI